MEVLCQATAGEPPPRRSIPAPLLARGDLHELAGFPFRLTQPTYRENPWPDPSVYVHCCPPALVPVPWHSPLSLGAVPRKQHPEVGFPFFVKTLFTRNIVTDETDDYYVGIRVVTT
jgi:hypothetical protein